MDTPKRELWAVDYGFRDVAHIVDSDKKKKAVIYPQANKDKEKDIANLIAAAPEMLEALGRIEALYSNLRHGGPAPEDLQSLSDALEEACDIARDAIELATNGAQPCPPSPAPN